MNKEHNKGSTPSLVIPALLVVVLALISSMLLLFSFVIWFSDLLGSLTLSLLITSVVLGGAAWLTYRIMLSPTLKRLREEYEMVISIMSLLRVGYESVVQRVMNFLKF